MAMSRSLGCCRHSLARDLYIAEVMIQSCDHEQQVDLPQPEGREGHEAAVSM